MFKKIITWVLLFCMVGSLCACSQTEENMNQGKTDNSASTQKEEEKEDSYVKPEMKGEITISCFFEEEFLATAAEQFMDLYPDVTVTINAYKDTAASASVEDYQTYLNTKIMSGKAEDIIFNSFLPVTKYSEMGVFEDLSKYISWTPEWTDDNYFMNVLTSAKEDGGEIYLLPYIAKFDVQGFSGELLSEQPQLENNIKDQSFSARMSVANELYSNTAKNNAYLIQLGELSYANYLIEDAFSEFIDDQNKTVNIKSDKYIKLLEEVKGLSEENAFGSDVDFYNGEYYYAAICDYDVQAAYYELDNSALVSYSMPMANKDGNISINANNCIALNSSSKNKNLAWEFIKYILSDEVQSQPSIHGLAVNKKGFEAAVERYYNFYSENNNGTVDRLEYQALLENWMGQINDCDTVDSALWALIEEENMKFFEGQQNAETTASVLQRKIEQYFNE